MSADLLYKMWPIKILRMILEIHLFMRLLQLVIWMLLGMVLIYSIFASKLYFLELSSKHRQPSHTVIFDWFMSGLEWILNLEFCLLKRLIFYQKLLWNIRSRLNSSTFWVFEPVFKYVWSKSSYLVHKASSLIKNI